MDFMTWSQYCKYTKGCVVKKNDSHATRWYLTKNVSTGQQKIHIKSV